MNETRRDSQVGGWLNVLVFIWEEGLLFGGESRVRLLFWVCPHPHPVRLAGAEKVYFEKVGKIPHDSFVKESGGCFPTVVCPWGCLGLDVGVTAPVESFVCGKPKPQDLRKAQFFISVLLKNQEEESF